MYDDECYDDELLIQLKQTHRTQRQCTYVHECNIAFIINLVDQE